MTAQARKTLDEERALHWLAQGAQPSASATALLKRTGIWQKHKQATASKRPAK